jgi:hypothetical protein
VAPDRPTAGGNRRVGFADRDLVVSVEAASASRGIIWRSSVVYRGGQPPELETAVVGVSSIYKDASLAVTVVVQSAMAAGQSGASGAGGVGSARPFFFVRSTGEGRYLEPIHGLGHNVRNSSLLALALAGGLGYATRTRATASGRQSDTVLAGRYVY